MNRALVVLGVAFALLLIIVGVIVVSTDVGPGVRVPTREEAEPDVPQPDLVPIAPVQKKRRDRGDKRLRRREDPLPEPPPFVGRVIGTITDAADARELPNVRVLVFHPTGETLGTALTDVHGNYDIGGLPDSVPLVLRLERANYLTGYCCDLTTSVDRVTTKDAAMSTGPTLTVRVMTRPWNQPAANVRVLLIQGANTIATAETDDEGHALLFAAAYGEYEVRLESATLATPPTDTIVLSGDEPAELDVTMVDGGTVRAAVSTSSGEPSPGAEVTLRMSGTPARKALTDQKGVAVFDRVHAPANATLVVVSPEGVEMSHEIKVQDRHITSLGMALPAFGLIGGSVADKSGAPVPDAAVEFTREDGAVTHRVTTDERGGFEHRGLRVGVWRVGVLRSDSNKASATNHVSVADGGRSTLEFVVEVPPSRVSGRVQDGDGQPIAGLLVVAEPSGRGANTGEDGSFSITASAEQALFASPPYRLLASDGAVGPRATPGQSARTSYLAVIESAPGAETEIVAEAEDTPDEEVEDAPDAEVEQWAETTVRGFVMGPSGNVARAVLVTVGGRKTYSAPDGSFELAGVAYDSDAGFLRLRFDPGPGLMLPATLLPDGNEDGVVDLGQVHLRSRPFIRIRQQRPRRWSMLTTYSDRFVGGGKAGPIECSSYDGAWIHLPPAGAGSPPFSPVGFVLVSLRTQRGSWVGYDAWRPASNPIEVLKARWRAQFKIGVTVPRDAVGGHLEFVQTAPVLDRFVTGATRPADVKALVETSFRVAIERERGTIAGVAPGHYTVRLIPRKGKAGGVELSLEGRSKSLDFRTRSKTKAKKPKKKQ